MITLFIENDFSVAKISKDDVLEKKSTKDKICYIVYQFDIFLTLQ